MALSSVVPRLTDAERAREPRSLGLVAWFDGWGQAQGMPPHTYPRLLDAAEGAEWREGWATAKAEEAAWNERIEESS